jgi:putative endonuclease
VSQPPETAVARGRRAEALAQDYLRVQGYQILLCNFRCTAGEIDCIAALDQVLCFIEVRARVSVAHGHPLETIGRVKQRRIIRAASMYLEQTPGVRGPMRFDALGIVLTEPPQFTLVQGAFEAFS